MAESDADPQDETKRKFRRSAGEEERQSAGYAAPGGGRGGSPGRGENRQEFRGGGGDTAVSRPRARSPDRTPRLPV